MKLLEDKEPTERVSDTNSKVMAFNRPLKEFRWIIISIKILIARELSLRVIHLNVIWKIMFTLKHLSGWFKEITPSSKLLITKQLSTSQLLLWSLRALKLALCQSSINTAHQARFNTTLFTICKQGNKSFGMGMCFHLLSGKLLSFQQVLIWPKSCPTTAWLKP